MRTVAILVVLAVALCALPALGVKPHHRHHRFKGKSKTKETQYSDLTIKDVSAELAFWSGNDGYVLAFIDADEPKLLNEKANTENPSWDDQLVFNTPAPESTITIQLWESDRWMDTVNDVSEHSSEGFFTGSDLLAQNSYKLSELSFRNGAITIKGGKNKITFTVEYAFMGETHEETQCETPAVRREWNDPANAKNRELYKRGTQELKNNGRWDQYSNAHKKLNDDGVIHNNPWFLGWHRDMLVSLENEIRELGEDFKCFALPYWDWNLGAATHASHPDAVANSSIFTADNFGSIDLQHARCVTDGPWANWKVPQGRYNPCRQDCLCRGGSGGGGFSGFSNTQKMLTENPDFHAASWYIENRLHNAVHVWVGGSMVTMNSPDDPIFYLHHNYIDHLWAEWQECHAHDQQETADRSESYSGSGARGVDQTFTTHQNVPRNPHTQQQVHKTRDLGYVFASSALEFDSAMALACKDKAHFTNLLEKRTTIRKKQHHKKGKAKKDEEARDAFLSSGPTDLESYVDISNGNYVTTLTQTQGDVGSAISQIATWECEQTELGKIDGGKFAQLSDPNLNCEQYSEDPRCSGACDGKAPTAEEIDSMQRGNSDVAVQQQN